MSTFLAPIEKPGSFGMRLAFYLSKKQFGKVMTSLKVYASRLPIAFGMFYGKVSELDKKLVLPKELILLLRQQIAQINICEFCIDASRFEAIKASASLEKFDALSNYLTSPLYSSREKTALDYVSELTHNKKVTQQTFDTLAQQFSEREICEIVHIVATEHLYNFANLGLNIHSDMLCLNTKKK